MELEGLATSVVAMSKEAEVAMRDHVTCIPKQSGNGVTVGGSLPFISGHRPYHENAMGNIPLRGTHAMAIESLKHVFHATPLLRGQTRIGWYCTAMQGGQKAQNRFNPVKAFLSQWNERNHGRDITRIPLTAVANDMDALFVARLMNN